MLNIRQPFDLTVTFRKRQYLILVALDTHAKYSLTKNLGAKTFLPFIYRLAKLKKENELVIRGSNAMANAYRGTNYKKWIPDYEPDYMKKLELQFEKDSLESGLLTPALIRY